MIKYHIAGVLRYVVSCCAAHKHALLLRCTQARAVAAHQVLYVKVVVAFLRGRRLMPSDGNRDQNQPRQGEGGRVEPNRKKCLDASNCRYVHYRGQICDSARSTLRIQMERQDHSQ